MLHILIVLINSYIRKSVQKKNLTLETIQFIIFFGSCQSVENGHFGGSRIGNTAKPSALFVAAMIGTWLTGGVTVPLALSYPEAELLHVLNDSVCLKMKPAPVNLTNAHSCILYIYQVSYLVKMGKE